MFRTRSEPSDNTDSSDSSDPAATDPVCGNGVLEEGELCDGDCPLSCSDNNACTTDSLIGAPDL